MKFFYQSLAQIVENHFPAVLCLVIETKGSTPRKTDSKMVVMPDGKVIGTIGGGKNRISSHRESTCH
ncbi:MAG TPA: XdhC family protein [Bacteroidales bacterium]|jgi:xanthine dehydrogenase accessory factor|nr:XdhC family protein [Bacteroidales bacterium]MDI9573186.1 XdhC family protein [Bacteroidota bacterium]OQC59402.1 MAG: XdhC and CoxI family protein [Bacteroidetes bacterium ADurb.Bin012]MBP9511856.1 XdhC family protein [Bacteroidales bacterium]MBP9588303.1 XdhC family protein [Bacteroidales bacterium]